MAGRNNFPPQSLMGNTVPLIDVEANTPGGPGGGGGIGRQQQQQQYIGQNFNGQTPIGGGMTTKVANTPPGTLTSGLKRAHYPIGVKNYRARNIMGVFLAELFAVTLFVAMVTFTIINNTGDKLAVAISTGFIVAALLFIFQEACGAHIFWFISLVETLGQEINMRMAVMFAAYFFAQIAGAIAGAGIVFGFEGEARAPKIEAGWTNGFGFAAEAIAAFLIGLAYFLQPSYAHDEMEQHGHMTRPLMIGFAYAVSVLALSHISGVSFTFARWIGPNVIHGFAAPSSSAWWVYSFGPLAGFIGAWGLSFLLANWMFKHAEPAAAYKEMAEKYE